MARLDVPSLKNKAFKLDTSKLKLDFSKFKMPEEKTEMTTPSYLGSVEDTLGIPDIGALEYAKSKSNLNFTGTGSDAVEGFFGAFENIGMQSKTDAKAKAQYAMLKLPESQRTPEKLKELEAQELSKISQRYAEARETTAGKFGAGIGEMGKFALGYAGGGGIVESGAKAVAGKLATGGKAAQLAGKALSTGMGVELTKDAIIGQSINLTEGLEQGLKGKELAKYMGTQALYDVAANALMLKLGKYWTKAEPEAVEQVLK